MARKADLQKKKDNLVAKIQKKIVAIRYALAVMDIGNFIKRECVEQKQKA